MRIAFHAFVGVLGLLLTPIGFLFAQTDTNEGNYGDEELRDLHERIQVLEARQAERIERELATLRAQLREARRLEQSRLARSPEAKKDSRPPQTTAERTASDQSWRYRYHRGRWWYWRPSNSWAVYEQNRWVSYQARGAARYYR